VILNCLCCSRFVSMLMMMLLVMSLSLLW